MNRDFKFVSGHKINACKIRKKWHECLHSIRRVALIRTLALKPDILLLDEPFSALDYQTRLMVQDDVYKIIRREHKTAVMITHDIEEACSMADRVVVLSKRPAVIKKIIKIEMDDKSSPINNRSCKEFGYYYDMIWKEIDNYD